MNALQWMFSIFIFLACAIYGIRTDAYCVGRKCFDHLEYCLGSNCSKTDGVWTSWVVVGRETCSGLCRFQARQLRYCTNPPPSGGGAPCPGKNDTIVSKPCFSEQCSENVTDIGDIVKHGTWTPWVVYKVTNCLRSCYHYLLKQRFCVQPSLKLGLRGCEGKHENFTLLPCIFGRCNLTKLKKADWGIWQSVNNTKCNTTCGKGYGRNFLQRTCTGYESYRVVSRCIGNNTSSYLFICEAYRQCDEEEGWNSWVKLKDETVCPHECVKKVNFTRTCTIRKIARLVSICEGPDMKTGFEVCFDGLCHFANGTWSLWKRQTEDAVACPSNCIHNVTYKRFCMQEYEGQLCIGENTSVVTEGCTGDKCVQNDYSYWGPWKVGYIGDCTRTCKDDPGSYRNVYFRMCESDTGCTGNQPFKIVNVFCPPAETCGGNAMWSHWRVVWNSDCGFDCMKTVVYKRKCAFETFSYARPICPGRASLIRKENCLMQNCKHKTTIDLVEFFDETNAELTGFFLGLGIILLMGMILSFMLMYIKSSLMTVDSMFFTKYEFNQNVSNVSNSYSLVLTDYVK